MSLLGTLDHTLMTSKNAKTLLYYLLPLQNEKKGLYTRMRVDVCMCRLSKQR